MGFSDSPTPALWVGNIKAGLQQKDIAGVFSSFGAIRRIKLGPAPPGTSATGLSAEVHFASIAQAASALTALNAIVVPRLSGHHPLAIQCWQPSGGDPSHVPAPASHARPPTTPLVVPRPPAAAAAKPAPAAPAAPAAAPGPLGPQQDVRPFNLAEAAAAVELPGAEDLQAAQAFFEGCSFLAVPEEERGCAVKWAVLQALLARGLRHLSGCTFRQLPVLLTHLGDELLQHRGSNPAVEAEYQSYPAAGRLTSLLKDIQYPGLVRVHNDGTTNTNIVQLHLGQLALAGGAPGGAPGGSATAGSGGSGSAAPPPKQRQGGAAGAAPSPKPKPAPPVPNQYETSSTPSRHLVLLGVAQRADVAVLTDMARQHGFVQKFLHNPRKASLVLHFSSIEEALSMAREVEGRTLPGLSGSNPLQVAYKHLVPASTAGTAGAAGQPNAPPAKQAAAAQPTAAKAKAGKGKAEAPVMWRYSATEPSCVVRVKKLNSSSATKQGLAQVGQSAGGHAYVDCTFFPSSSIGYLFFKTEAAATAAAAVLRGSDLPWSQGEELVVEFRQPARSDGKPSAAGAAAAAAGGKGGAAAGAAAAAEEAPPCCDCCGASGEGVALSRCSGCRVVHYCGRDCQLKDWAPRHATECAQLQQLAAALQAAQPAAAGPQAQLLIAALRSPGGREAAMLRSLLGEDAVPGGSEQDGSGRSDNGAANGSVGGSSASGRDALAGEAAAAVAEEQAPSNGGEAAAEAAVSAEASDGEQAAAAAAAAGEPAAAAAAEGSPVGEPSGATDGGRAAGEEEEQQPVGQASAGGETAAPGKGPSEPEGTVSAADAEAAAAAEGQEGVEQQAGAEQQAEPVDAQPAEAATAAEGQEGAEQQAEPAEQQPAEPGADEQAAAEAAAAAEGQEGIEQQAETGADEQPAEAGADELAAAEAAVAADGQSVPEAVAAEQSADEPAAQAEAGAAADPAADAAAVEQAEGQRTPEGQPAVGAAADERAAA